MISFERILGIRPGNVALSQSFEARLSSQDKLDTLEQLELGIQKSSTSLSLDISLPHLVSIL